MPEQDLDCVVIGYNESPFEEYEKRIRKYGENSEAYRDLQFSFVDVGGRKLNYVDLMNHVYALAKGNGGNGGPGVDGGRAPDVLISGEIPNLAAVYLTNFLRQRGYAADYINLFQYEKDRLRHFLEERNPSCVAITTTFYVLNFPVIEMTEFIRRHNPDTRIVVGGPLVSNHLRNYEGDQLRVSLADLGADVLVCDSQGEDTLAQLCQCLREDGDLSRVPNILYWEDGELQRSPVKPENNSLNENVIDWRGFPDRDLGPTLQTRTARSCAFSCAFCNYPTRAGKLTLANIDAIEQELDAMHALGNVGNVVFIDDTFNVPLPRFKDICRLMIEKDYGFRWFSYFRCSNSDEEAFDLMAEAGCTGVFLGIESGSPSILKNMSKHATVKQYSAGIEALKERGVITFGSFITGFPGESDETVRETTDFVRDTAPDYWRSQMWYNEPGTPIQQRRDEFEISGEGFVWEHSSMDSLAAMDHIDRMFLEVQESTWLPQWSFDFWFIPYALGRGLTREQFKTFTDGAEELLRLEIATVPERRKATLQKKALQRMVDDAKNWKIEG